MAEAAEKHDEETEAELDKWVEAELDKWVEAKRRKDFRTADLLREGLRAKGIEPDKVRPPDYVLQRAPPGMNAGGAPARPPVAPYSEPVHCPPVMPTHGPIPPRTSSLGKRARSDDLPSYDAETEAKLEKWVGCKRRKEFAEADAIREELRADGIDPDKARPAWPTGAPASRPAAVHPPAYHAPPPAAPTWSAGADFQEMLDRWVEAKRQRDFTTADALRHQLRLAGIDPDGARPSDARQPPAVHSYGAAACYGAPLAQPGYRPPPTAYAPPPFAPHVPPIMPMHRPPPPMYAPPPTYGQAGGVCAPPGGHGGGGGARPRGGSIDAQLDRWVNAKRRKDFGLADSIREELRARGVDPEKARPP